MCYEFDLYDPDDSLEISRHGKVDQMARGIRDWTEHLDRLRDYPADEFNHSIVAMLDCLWDKWFSLWEDCDIDPRDI